MFPRSEEHQIDSDVRPGYMDREVFRSGLGYSYAATLNKIAYRVYTTCGQVFLLSFNKNKYLQLAYRIISWVSYRSFVVKILCFNF